MKRSFIALLALLAFTFFASAQEGESYELLESTHIVVKTDSYKAFGDAMSSHNKKYHSGGAHHANIWMISVGARAGNFVWMMGPCTYGDLDTRPSGEDHMEDWLYNVMPTVKYTTQTKYWRLDKKHSYNPENKLFDKYQIRYYDLEDWQSYRFKDLLTKVKEVYEKKQYKWVYATYWSEFDVNNDEDVAIVWGFDKWASFDENPTFKKDYEEVHGEGSWDKFREELRSVVKGAKDEVWELVPELSGDRPE